MKITIGDYLIKRLKEVGVDHIIGEPGDFNLQFLEQVENSGKLDFIGASNELNGAYAADGYARAKGISAFLVTYGVGDLGGILGVAGASAERVPMIVITGAPPNYVMKHGLKVHHSVADGDYDNVSNIYREFNINSYKLTHENAAEIIDRAILEAINNKGPVNISLPSNISYLEIEDIEEKLVYKSPISDSKNLEQAANKIVQLIKEAKNPVFLVDLNVDRFSITEEVNELVKMLRIPYAQLSTGKAILNEKDDLFIGTYKGKDSEKDVIEKVESADLILSPVLKIVEWNSGEFSMNIEKEKSVFIGKDHVIIKRDESFEGIYPNDLMNLILEKLEEDIEISNKSQQKPETKDKEEELSYNLEDKINQENLWKAVGTLLKEEDVVFAETGSSLHGLMGVKMPDNVKFVGSHIWGAIGFTLPAYFGSLLADPSKRQLLFIGDGSFQVTAQALSRMLFYDLKPTIFIIENSGYTIERYIMGMNREYNDIPKWDYLSLPQVLSDKSNVTTVKVSTIKDLLSLKDKINKDKALIVEINLDKEDAPKALKEFGPKVNRFNYGDRAPKN